MIRIVTTLLCFLAGYAAGAQNQKLDSLDNLISKATTDTAKINLELKKSSLISRINIDSGLNLNKRLLARAKSINYPNGEASARLSLASNYCMKGSFDLAAENLSISKNIFSSLKDDGGLCNTYSGYGMMYGMQSKYDTSIQYFENAIALAERNNFKDKLPSYYGNIAIDYQQQSNFLKALSYQQKALDLAKSANDLVNEAYVTLNMGLTYSDINDITRAQNFLLEAIRLAKLEHMTNVELYGYTNLAGLYDKKKNPQKAYEYAIKAAKLGKITGDFGIQASSLAKAANALANMKQYEEAEKLAGQAIVIADSSNQSYNLYQSYAVMGSVLKLQQKFKEAASFLEKAVNILEKTDLYNEEVQSTYNDLSACYEKMGEFAKALSFYKTSAQIKDSVTSRDNVRKTTELGMNYEFEKKQEAQQILQQNKDAVTQAKQMALLIVLGLTVISAIGAFTAYRNKRKANTQLEAQKQEIERTLTQLKSTQAQLVQAEKMASLGELTAGIAHEIQNPLNFVNNFSDINAELVADLNEELDKGNTAEARAIAADIKENEQKINHHGKRADAIVKSMLQHSRSSATQKESTSINALAGEYLRLSYHGLRAKDKMFNATMHTHFDEAAGKVNIVSQDVGRVLLNLLNNAFYAVYEKKKATDRQGGENTYQPTVFVSTKKVNNTIEVKVSDNGFGIPQQDIDKIFQPFFTTKPPGQGTGLGLSLSYDIIKAHGGELKAETKPGEGASFIITLPLGQG